MTDAKDGARVWQRAKVAVARLDPRRPDYVPPKVYAADEINWDALLDELGRSRWDYRLVPPPEDADEDWFDRTAAMNDAIRSDEQGRRNIDWLRITQEGRSDG